MLALKCLASGSSGNCYLLSAESETLILDCGIPIMEIKKGLDFDLSNVVGCVVTHSHKDHSQSVEDLKKTGIPAWEPYNDIIRLRKFGGFSVQAFQVPHDNTDCLGFYIKVDGQKMLYMTDFEYVPFSFRTIGIQHLLIECNYQNKYVDKLAINRKHVLRGHAELETTIGIIRDNIDSLRNVILCHLSENNSDPYECVAGVQKAVGNGVHVDWARKGLEVDLEKGG